MAWRRAVGAVVMGLGGALLLATVAAGTVLTVSHIKSAEVFAPLHILAAAGGGALAGGVALLLAGRAIYGRWNKSAPIANFTGDVARMIGLSIAFGLGAMLAFLLLTGMKAEDGVAAIMLGVGALAGVGLAYIGGNLRSGGRSYLD